MQYTIRNHAWNAELNEAEQNHYNDFIALIGQAANFKGFLYQLQQDGFQIKRLKTSPKIHQYEFYLNGGNRLTFTEEGGMVKILQIGGHT